MPTHRQLALQAGVAVFTFSLAWPYYYLRETPWDWGSISLLIGFSAFLVARFSRQPWWWQLIHMLFAPLAWLGQQVTISPLWHLAAFLTLLLIFRGAASGQIPLYLSNRETARRISELSPPGAKLVDLGAGIASLLLPLHKLRPDLRLTGIDNAPIPWLIGKIRTMRSSEVHWAWGDLWTHDIHPYDVVYCFLSPAPMQSIWLKAINEMRPGSLLISKAFPIQDVTPELTLGSDASPSDILFIYRIPERI